MQINCPILYRLLYISLLLTHNVLALQKRDFKKPTEKVKCKCEPHITPSFRLSSCFNSCISTALDRLYSWIFEWNHENMHRRRKRRIQTLHSMTSDEKFMGTCTLSWRCTYHINSRYKRKCKLTSTQVETVGSELEQQMAMVKTSES